MTAIRVWGGVLMAACAAILAACGGTSSDTTGLTSGMTTVERRIDPARSQESSEDESVLAPVGGAVQFDDEPGQQAATAYEGEQVLGLSVQARSAQAGLIRPREPGLAPDPAWIDLGSASDAERSLLRSAPAGKQTDEQRRPVAIGFGRKVQEAQADQAARQMQWRSLPQERQAAAMAVRSGGAKAVRLGVQFDSLPRDARVRFYASGSETMTDYPASHILRVMESNRTAGMAERLAPVFWGPVIEGDSAVVEVVRSAGSSTAEAGFRVVQVLQMDRSPEQTAGAMLARSGPERGQSDYCQVDAICPDSTTGEASHAASVAAQAALLLDYVEFDPFGFAIGYTCTGTLLTDAARTGAAYVLTADHCISSQTTAQTVQAYQYFRSATCNDADSRDGRLTLLPGYVNYLYSEKRSTGTDIALLSLAYHGDVGLSLAGWNAASVSAATAVEVFHHPAGDLLKRSKGTARPKNTNYLSVNWSQGVTEGGSSGSALLNPSRQVIGTLWGGSSYCAMPNLADEFGRFSAAYARGLRKWLHVPGYRIGGIGDLDGDGHKDLLWYQKAGSNLQTIVSRHDDLAAVTGWINPHVEGSDSYHDQVPYLVALQDLNGDGKDDLIFKYPNAKGDRYELVAQYRDASGTWRYDRLQGNIANTVRVVGYVDMDDNGVKDLVLHNTVATNVETVDGAVYKAKEVNVITFELDGQGRLAPKDVFVQYPYASDRPLAVGDFWGDGKGEIVWRNPNFPKDVIILSLDFGNTELQFRETINGFQAFPGVLIGAADFDGDGKTDLAFNNAGVIQFMSPAMQGPTPYFAPPRRLIAAVPAGFTLAAVGDVDGDGRADTVWRNGSDVRVARSVTRPVTWQKLNLLQ